MRNIPTPDQQKINSMLNEVNKELLLPFSKCHKLSKILYNNYTTISETEKALVDDSFEAIKILYDKLELYNKLIFRILYGNKDISFLETL